MHNVLMLLKVLNTFKGINFAITWKQTDYYCEVTYQNFSIFFS